MKKIQREETKVVYKDIYVSVDGKEFDNEADCKAWEKSYEGTIKASWELIKKIKIDPTDIGYPGSNQDDECYVIEPKNLDEIVLINAYIESSVYDSFGTTLLTTEHIGKLVAINFGYDHDWCGIYTFESILNGITKKMSEVKTEMHKGEKEETECQELNK